MNNPSLDRTELRVKEIKSIPATQHFSKLFFVADAILVHNLFPSKSVLSFKEVENEKK